MRTRSVRSSGPVARSNGSPPAAASSRSASSARSGSGSERRSTDRSSIQRCGRISDTGSPFTALNVVRSDSCRRTISLTLRSSTSSSNASPMRMAPLRLNNVVPGISWSRNQRRCCANDSGAGDDTRLGVIVTTRRAGSDEDEASFSKIARFSGDSSWIRLSSDWGRFVVLLTGRRPRRRAAPAPRCRTGPRPDRAQRRSSPPARRP